MILLFESALFVMLFSDATVGVRLLSSDLVQHILYNSIDMGM